MAVQMNRVVAALVLAIVSGIALAAATSAIAGRTVYAPKDCTRPRVEPSRIVFTCADGGIFFTAKHWKYWNEREAGAKGKIHANNCKPICAGGTFHTYKARIRVYKVRVRTCNGRRVPIFQKAEVHFGGKKPHGVKRTQRFPLFCY